MKLRMSMNKPGLELRGTVPAALTQTLCSGGERRQHRSAAVAEVGEDQPSSSMVFPHGTVSSWTLAEVPVSRPRARCPQYPQHPAPGRSQCQACLGHSVPQVLHDVCQEVTFQQEPGQGGTLQADTTKWVYGRWGLEPKPPRRLSELALGSDPVLLPPV